MIESYKFLEIDLCCVGVKEVFVSACLLSPLFCFLRNIIYRTISFIVSIEPPFVLGVTVHYNSDFNFPSTCDWREAPIQ